MHAALARLFRDALTDAGNTTFELFRVSAALSVFAFIVYSGFAVFVLGEWSPIEYGTGIGLVLAGTGAALRLKGEDTREVAP